jgi:hypothetical protein
MLYSAPATISVPKMIIMKAHKGKSILRKEVTPHRMIRRPITKPAIDPPLGNPKHSLSLRRRSRLTRERPTNGSLHLTQTSASSSFFVPHFVQYTIFFTNIFVTKPNG